MRIILFYHSLVSDWNHGNAHFLRGIATELLARDHEVVVYEPADGWSLKNLLREYGPQPLQRFQAAYPELESVPYHWSQLNLDRVLDGADLVLVHEWNEAQLVRRLGEHRARRGHYRLLFHDTHHRMVTNPQGMDDYDLRHYDGVLAYGKVLRELYLSEGRARRAWTWHEAADTRIFHPLPGLTPEGDLVWIGNWGDEERTEELHEFLVDPVKALGLKAKVFGVRYPEAGLRNLREAAIQYGGWLPNYEVPKTFARYRVTVHVQRRPYVHRLPGIPTIRPFEAMACGIPLICSPWQDAEGLFSPGEDYLTAHNGEEMRRQLLRVLRDDGLRRSLAQHGVETIRTRHTCSHRVDELLNIADGLRQRRSARKAISTI